MPAASVNRPASAADFQRTGFPMGGEPIVALDLADTLMLAVDPAVDLLADHDRAAAWWALQAMRLPDGPVPEPAATRRLRAAIRDLLDARLAGRAPATTSAEDLNAIAASVPTSLRLTLDSGDMRRERRWHTEHGGNARLAAIATEAIDLLAAPGRVGRLRRCANPACSMLFLAENARRQWCASNICGNRVRVARHYRRHHDEP